MSSIERYVEWCRERDLKPSHFESIIAYKNK